MYRKQTKMVLHKTFMAITSSPGHKHDRVHKFIKIFVMLSTLQNNKSSIHFCHRLYTEQRTTPQSMSERKRSNFMYHIIITLFINVLHITTTLFVQVYSKNSSCRPTHILNTQLNVTPSVHLQL